MTQQPHDMYLDYSVPANRSPSSTRPGYGGGGGGGGGFQSTFSLPRGAQRQFDNTPASMYPADRLGIGYGGRMDQMPGMGGVGALHGYMMDNAQSWNYNAANVATVNGAMNGTNRGRGVNRRAALPSTWTDPSALGMVGAFPPVGMNGHHMSNGLRMDQAGVGDHRGAGGQGGDSDQLIPTAIVIKNIPFAVRKETLAAMMIEMQLPQPYAFNYHFDNGVFRGLAFANFQSPEDTRIVIEAMNGYEVQGRKLRVEYKKMLPEAERERIEREKRERRGQLEEQHRTPILHQQPSLQTLSSIGSQQARNSLLRDVDLNDPQTLEYYTQLTIFRSDDTREILIFPPGVTPEQRRQIHILAHHMGLEHQSVGDADSRQIHIYKNPMPSPTNQPHTATSVGIDLHKRGLSRAATFDFAADRESRNATGNYSLAIGRQGPTLELPGSPDGSGIPSNLRTAKSFADLRSFSPSPSHSPSRFLNPAGGISGLPAAGMARLGDYSGNMGSSGTPTDSSLLANTLSGLNLGSYETGSGLGQNRSTPGAIGSQRPGAGGHTTSSTRGAPERQPRGPEWEASAGFGGRGRTNGHMQRGSDSSESGSRAGPGLTATRFH